MVRFFFVRLVLYFGDIGYRFSTYGIFYLTEEAFGKYFINFNLVYGESYVSIKTCY